MKGPLGASLLVHRVGPALAEHGHVGSPAELPGEAGVRAWGTS